ncbi:EthD domain-containing protein [Mycobacterium sp. GA-2829]|uniref:EthD domain-containing protein n=1 Tax=Mycobacterium sp. GA-2829 TaxID=1772283 RepID=UPI00073FFEBD|nr:EthD domain-containing protein [Mycobacterium sp. GA-2829]KUI29277.1 hypothetical protein AU194_20605 [Mycobacterium sp. GA-2829]
MPKLILLVRRRDDFTHEEFADRYESGHAPLARRTLPKLRKYVRNYLTPVPGIPELNFDCCTEFWFDSQGDLEETLAWYATEEGQVLVRDEAEFMDRDSMRAFITQETELTNN